jgi:putative DNA primase/helicase
MNWRDPSWGEAARKYVEESSAHLISRCAAEIDPKRIDFLWPGRIARGKHTAIAGEPGDGKSQLSVYVTAIVSRGGDWPCGEGRAPIGNVIILNAEDGADDTVVPRLIAAGADLRRVHIVSAVLQGGNKGRRAFNLQADLALLERRIAEIGDVALVIIDPISSYMGKADSHKNAEVRGALEPLSEMAERLKVAILSITHFSKSGAGNNSKALHRFIGSIAFVGAPRAAFAVIEDVDNEGRILFLHAKNNMAGKPQGLAYRLAQMIVGETGQGIVASYVVWDSTPVTMSANEALRATDGGGDRTAAAEAEEFLRETLSGGTKPATDIKAETNEAGLSWATIRRAKDRLGVTAERESQGRDGRGRWLWTLPSAARCSSNLQDAHLSDVSALHQNEHLAEKAPLQAQPPKAGNGHGLCAQCHGEEGAPPTLHTGAAYPPEGIWLHKECMRFWARDGIPESLRRQ